MGRYPGACAFRPDLPLPGMAGRRNADSTPICRCRVLYLGSAVPHVTKDGLQGIQEPLRELYPEQGAVGARGIDSWLSVWSNGVLLENVDENHKKVTRFFPIETLHYCAAVRYVLVPEKSPGTSAARPRFLPLDSPFARSPDPDHPPLFACILRRTTGIKVLECHAFICKREMAANALVRCCFHAYADSAYARHVDGGGTPAGGGGGYSVYGTVRTETRTPAGDRAGIEKVEGWRRAAAGSGLEGTPSPPPPPPPVGHVRDRSDSADDSSAYNGDENHKIWAGAGKEAVPGEEVIYGGEPEGTLSTRRSRPRQTVSVPPPPPPPPQERLEKASKDKTANKKSKTKAREEIYWTGSRKAAGGARRPSRGAVGGGAATLPHPRGPVVVGPLVVSRYPPPRRAPREEPLYMPSDRPMSPLSSYQPCHFPHEAYLMRRYATADEPPDRRRERPRKETKRRSRRHEHDDRSEDGSDGEGDSLYDTGIYGRKGHLNERAFSYSIRQEHRSRSYGSLANLRQGNYGPGPTDRESKKEREIVQMMRHLELSPDDIERSQVPAALYRHPARTEDKFSRR